MQSDFFCLHKHANFAPTNAGAACVTPTTMHNTQGYRITNSGTAAEVYLYGIIGLGDIDITALVAHLESLRAAGTTSVTFYLNSEGGDVQGGIALFSYLFRTPFAVTWVVDGVAASMAGVLLCNPNHTVIMGKHAKIMVHRVSGCVWGNADEIKEYAATMFDFENSLIDLLATRTTLDPKEVKKRWFDGKNHWINAADALSLGLCDKIIESRVPAAPGDLTDVHAVYNHYTNQLTNLQTNNTNAMKDIKRFITLLNLGDSADEEAVYSAAQAAVAKSTALQNTLASLEAEKRTLSDKLTALQGAQVKALIDSAIADKKFGEPLRNEYTEMAADNFERTQKIIAAMPGVPTLANQLTGDATAVPEAEKAWGWDEYHRAGKLENLKATNTARYAALFKAKFNREP